MYSKLGNGGKYDGENDYERTGTCSTDYGYLAVKDVGTYTGKGRPPAIVYVVNPYIFNNE